MATDQILGQKIVVHFRDGSVLKGYSQDFFPNKDRFHLTVLNQPSDQKATEVFLENLKAVFFVKDFVGNKDHERFKGFPESQSSTYGKKTVVKCRDGEVLYGFTQSYAPNRIGFFLFPCDPSSNNIKVFVLQSFVTHVEFPT